MENNKNKDKKELDTVIFKLLEMQYKIINYRNKK